MLQATRSAQAPRPGGMAHPTRADGQTMVEFSLILGMIVVAAVLLLPPLWWVAFGIYDTIVQAFAGLSMAPGV